MGADVLAVIVSYHPDESIVANAAAIASQVGSVLVVDNGSSAEADRYLSSIAELDNAVGESPSRALVELLQRAVGHVVKVIMHADDSDGL
ncbi:MAG: hypothetical protein GEU90_10795, partial [Gemmatimonas sp.]|nr:hypothetical protein [Gemmatimonas sp.]